MVFVISGVIGAVSFSVLYHALGDWVIWTSGVLLGFGALGHYGRKAFQMFKRFQRLYDLADYELRNNGGGSIKDSVDKSLSNSAEALQITRDLSTKFDAYVQANTTERTAIWSQISAMANNRPSTVVFPSSTKVNIGEEKSA